MAYFIFLKSLEDTSHSLSRIAENEFDLDNLNIIKSDYRIIEESQEKFNEFKYSDKRIIKHVGNTIYYEDNIWYRKSDGLPSELMFFQDHTDKQGTFISGKEKLKNYINSYSDQIKHFLNCNPNHILFNRWSDYLNELNTLNLDNINFPLKMSLEKYLNGLGKTSFHILQLP
jgi:hypothetical protein